MEHVTHASQPVLVHGFCGGFFLSLWCNEAEIQYTAAPPPIPDHLTKHLPKPNSSTADSSFVNTQWIHALFTCAIFHDHLIPEASPSKNPSHESDNSTKWLVPIVADRTNDYNYCIPIHG